MLWVKFNFMEASRNSQIISYFLNFMHILGNSELVMNHWVLNKIFRILANIYAYEMYFSVVLNNNDFKKTVNDNLPTTWPRKSKMASLLSIN